MGCFRDNTNPIGCCHDCKERFPACHDVCVTYLEQKAEMLERKKKINEAKAKDFGFNRYHYERVQVSRKIGRAKGKIY